MTSKVTLRGMTTVSFYAADMNAAKQWYSDLFGIEPYFVRPGANQPAYIEFRLGDYQHELGIIDRKYAPKETATEPGGAILFWHVDDLDATFATLKQMGAQEFEPITKRGDGFITASVIDPFGNILGIMYNQHYLDMIAATKKA